MLLDRADTLIWIDLPFPLVLWQVTTRTLRRSIFHEELWNGDIEEPFYRILWSRDHIVRWAVRHRHQILHKMPAIRTEHPHIQAIRLVSRRQIRDFLRVLKRTRAL